MSNFERILPDAVSAGGYTPEPNCHIPYIEHGERVPLSIDSAGNLMIRGLITTDEGSIREPFAGTSLSNPITGTITFTIGSRTVIGTGTNFTTCGMKRYDYIKCDACDEGDWIYGRIQDIESDTVLHLTVPYHESESGVASFAAFMRQTAVGASIDVANSFVTLSGGTTDSGFTYIARAIDYCPLILTVFGSISQRINNQVIKFGLSDMDGVNNNRSCFLFDGTDDSIVKCTTSIDANRVDITTVSLPDGIRSSDIAEYRLEVSPSYVQFTINGVVMATHTNNIPSPYAYMTLGVAIINEIGIASNTHIDIDTIFINNLDSLQISPGLSGVPFKFEPMPFVKLDQTSGNSLNAEILPGTNISGYKSIGIAITGTWSGIVTFKASMDNITYHDIMATNMTTNVTVINTNKNGLFVIPNSGFMFVKAVLTSYLSGTVLCDVALSSMPLNIPSSSPTATLIDTEAGYKNSVTIFGEQKVTSTVRLVGGAMSGPTLDTTRWLSTTANGGTTVQANGLCTLTNTTTNGGVARITSKRLARSIISSINQFAGLARFRDTGVTNNVRRVGVFNDNNGYFFQLSGTTFSVVTRKNAVDTVITTFNGSYGTIWAPLTYTHLFVIDYNMAGGKFYVDSKLLYSTSLAGDPATAEADYNIRIENINTGTVVGSPAIDTSGLAVIREGALVGQPRYVEINTNGTFTLKLGTGIFNKMVTGGTFGSSARITIYDSLTGSGSVIHNIDLSVTDAAMTLDYNCSYNNGLTVVTTGLAAGDSICILYE